MNSFGLSRSRIGSGTAWAAGPYQAGRAGSEPAFALSQALRLLLFVWIGWRVRRRLHGGFAA